MARNHFIKPTVPATPSISVRLGASAAGYTDKENGKFVKFNNTDSAYILAAAGDPIEGVITSVEPATQNGFSIGGVATREQFLEVTADGLQATPGTGTIALGDYVVVGTVVAFGTAMTVFPKVTKATVQPGSVPADLTAAGAMVKAALFAWRVVSLGSGGVGTVGGTITIQRVNAA